MALFVSCPVCKREVGAIGFPDEANVTVECHGDRRQPQVAARFTGRLSTPTCKGSATRVPRSRCK
jgi:hypothetical protein